MGGDKGELGQLTIAAFDLRLVGLRGDFEPFAGIDVLETGPDLSVR